MLNSFNGKINKHKRKGAAAVTAAYKHNNNSRVKCPSNHSNVNKTFAHL